MRFFLLINILLVLNPLNVFSRTETNERANLSADGFLSGLYFSSHEVIQDKRTSLNLTPDKPFKFPDGFSLEFDANFRRKDGYYGYIFRIIGDGNTNIDLVANFASSTSNFWLVHQDQILLSYKWADLSNGDYGLWMKIRVEIDLENARLGVNLNGIKKEATVADIGHLKHFDVVFGACQNNPFYTTDVCPMSLKNIRIYNSSNRLYRNWQLSRHGENEVFDEVVGEKAKVNNPVWIIDKHIRWRKLKDIRVDNLLGIAKDEENGRLFLVNDQQLYVVNTDSFLIDIIPFEGGSPYWDPLGKQIIYNKFTDDLWSYNFSKNEISRFDFRTRKWSANPSDYPESDFAHHNKFIHPRDSSLVTILGYGHYLYKSTVNYYHSGIWRQIDRSDQIEPRYLSGTGFLNEQKMLVFGGYGSKSGRQELSSGFYYDLYLFDLNDYSFKKLWNLTSPDSPYVPSDDLIFDQQSNSFYTLVYNSVRYETYLRLARFGIEKANPQFYHDSIPFKFRDTESWNAFSLNHSTSELIAVTAQNNDVSLYAIAYPPLLPEDVYQQEEIANSYELIIFVFILFLLGAGTYFILRRRKIKPVHKTDQKHDHPGIGPVPAADRKLLSSILFLGGFQIYDRNGLDITSDFSPTIKQLFVFIFLYTIRSGKGISSAKLDEILWYDKSKESARNNRNVNISKLRSVLENVGGVEVVNENLFWKITIQDQIYCDYIEVLHLLEKSKISHLEEPEVCRLAGLLSYGEMLPNVKTSWVDPFKSAFANSIVDCLTILINAESLKNNISLRYHLTDCIFVYDPVNEDALVVKCSILDQVGKRSIARQVYDSFCKEYKQMLGTAYPVPFSKIIKT
jgi:DNA-binding SARP family transcriptional activator